MADATNKIALVTGAGTGVGRAASLALMNSGFTVVLAGRRMEMLEETKKLGDNVGKSLCVSADMTSPASIAALFDKVKETYGRLDVLFNNAGMTVKRASIEDVDIDEWKRVVDTNLTGPLLCTREAFRIMKAQGGGRIINISSVAGYLPIPENGAYGTSKFALNGFSQILNEEGKHHGVRVTIVDVGATMTDMSRDRFDPADMLRPEDIAESVLDAARRPLHVRIDEVRILPPKGIL